LIWQCKADENARRNATCRSSEAAASALNRAAYQSNFNGTFCGAERVMIQHISRRQDTNDVRAACDEHAYQAADT
jgi:hypothetical protein